MLLTDIEQYFTSDFLHIQFRPHQQEFFRQIESRQSMITLKERNAGGSFCLMAYATYLTSLYNNVLYVVPDSKQIKYVLDQLTNKSFYLAPCGHNKVMRLKTGACVTVMEASSLLRTIISGTTASIVFDEVSLCNKEADNVINEARVHLEPDGKMLFMSSMPQTNNKTLPFIFL